MTDLEEIIAEINRIDGCGVTKSRVVAVLRSQVGKRVYFAKGVLTLPQQIAPRNAARDALMIRLRVSRAVAYELIRRALNAPQQEALL
jgi:hypothetical protein